MHSVNEKGMKRSIGGEIKQDFLPNMYFLVQNNLKKIGIPQ